MPEQRPLWKSFVVPLLPIPFFVVGCLVITTFADGYLESALLLTVALASAALAVVTSPSMFGRYGRSEKWYEFLHQPPK